MARNRSVAPLDEKKMNLTPYACSQGYNSHFVEKLLDMSYGARAGNCGGRVSPLAQRVNRAEVWTHRAGK